MLIFLEELANLVISSILWSLCAFYFTVQEISLSCLSKLSFKCFALDHVFHCKYNVLTFLFEVFFFNSIIPWVQHHVLHAAITYGFSKAFSSAACFGF